jgi:Ca2+-transporting ATPase
LGSSIFNIAQGVPLVPLQTLWINFTTQVCMAIGLGFGTPADDIMDRTPRRIDERILPRDVLSWLAFAGLIMGAGTLAVVAWADNAHDIATGRTMALATFGIANVALGFTVRDKFKSVFRHATIEDHKFLIAAGLGLLSVIVAVETRIGNRFLQTVDLTFNQWVIAAAVGSSILFVSEIYKAILRARTPEEVR